jgi:hypothetical protein
MMRDAFYASRDFWMGVGIGLTVLLLAFAVLLAKRYLLQHIRAQIAERVSKDFVVAAEIFDLLRVSGGPCEERAADFFPELQARVESHSDFFQRLLNERRHFCFFFGATFDLAFEDIRATYNDLVSGCEMLHLYRDALQAGDLEALGPHRRLVPVLFRHADSSQDVTRFRMLRAMALVHSVYAPILAERHRRQQRAATGDAADACIAR